MRVEPYYYSGNAKKAVNRRTGPMGPWIEHLMDDEGFSYEEARAGCLKWEMIPYVDPVHGHMATLAKRNKEVHFAIFKKFRGRAYVNMRRIKEFLQPILEKEVFLVTKIDDQKDAKFLEHLGFEQLSIANDEITCYILNNIKYPRTRQ